MGCVYAALRTSCCTQSTPRHACVHARPCQAHRPRRPQRPSPPIAVVQRGARVSFLLQSLRRLEERLQAPRDRISKAPPGVCGRAMPKRDSAAAVPDTAASPRVACAADDAEAERHSNCTHPARPSATPVDRLDVRVVVPAPAQPQPRAQARAESAPIRMVDRRISPSALVKAAGVEQATYRYSNCPSGRDTKKPAPRPHCSVVPASGGQIYVTELARQLLGSEEGCVF